MLTSNQYTNKCAVKLKNNNKCAQQRNTHHDVEGEILEGQQGRGHDKINDKLSCVVAVITI